MPYSCFYPALTRTPPSRCPALPPVSPAAPLPVPSSLSCPICSTLPNYQTIHLEFNSELLREIDRLFGKFQNSILYSPQNFGKSFLSAAAATVSPCGFLKHQLFKSKKLNVVKKPRNSNQNINTSLADFCKIFFLKRK